MKKRNQLCGIGTALVDVLVHVDESTFAALDLERATMRLVDGPTQAALLARVPASSALVSGGSVANSVIAFAQLGGRGSLLSLVGDDRYGLFYKSECESLRIELVNPPVVGAQTGTCAAFITPDAERTMRTHLGVGAEFSPPHVDERAVRDSDWLFVEGYVFANGERSQRAIDEAVRIAAGAECRVALTCSEAWIIESFGAPLRRTLEHVDLLFTNDDEARALTGHGEPERAFRALTELVPNAVMTCGPRGAFIAYNGTHGQVDAYPCTPVDLTGAGDMFAGTFLYCIVHGIEPLAAGRAACFLSMQVITRLGARLHTGARGYLEEVLGGAAPPAG